MAQEIYYAVGRRGARNDSEDVWTVQALLNKVRHGEGRPVPLLVEDAICGPKTIGAIQKFQIHHFGWSGADGRVDPDGPTLRKLNDYDTPVPRRAEARPLTFFSTMICPHGGHVYGMPRGSMEPISGSVMSHSRVLSHSRFGERGVTLGPNIRRVLRGLLTSGRPCRTVLKASDEFVVVGCTLRAAGQKSSPCITVRWAGPGSQTLTHRSVGMCYNAMNVLQGRVIVVR